MRAFFDLSTCRHVDGMGGIGPVPWTAIVSYADRAGLDREAGDLFVEAIRALDRAYLDDERERMKKEARHG